MFARRERILAASARHAMLLVMTTSPLQLLVLGGTSWLGGATARLARDAGHQVTCLARGASGRPPEGVTWVRSDRDEPGGYDDVKGQDWDAVIDVSWQPDQVRSALAALGERAGHWVYVSSCSVYADDGTPGEDESAAVHPAHEGSGRVDMEAYGPAKVACEQACLDALGHERVAVARSGLIGGYGDLSDRFGYWPARVARAEDSEPVLSPPRDTPLQIIDVEDLAAWLVHLATTATAGVFNALGDSLPLGGLLDAAGEAAGRTPSYVEVSDDWLVAHEVEPWSGTDSLPVWLPQADYAGFMRRTNDAAKDAGLRLRPLAETVASSLEWERERGLDRDRRAGLSPLAEERLLAQVQPAGDAP